MVEADIIRKATPTEKMDFKEIGEKNLEDFFRAKLAEEQHKFTRAHKPYCGRCAHLDFDDKVEKLVKEEHRRHGYVTWDKKTKATLDSFNLEMYGKPERFKLLEETQVIEDKLLDGIRTPVNTGVNQNFVCKARGCGITVFVPLREYEKRKRLTTPELPEKK